MVCSKQMANLELSAALRVRGNWLVLRAGAPGSIRFHASPRSTRIGIMLNCMDHGKRLVTTVRFYFLTRPNGNLQIKIEADLKTQLGIMDYILTFVIPGG
ncbi:uncharacterized protein DS421_13g416960 [Arachis hypogaea]|nr:uncharacterized protein DS421_13g416960 [Arachis hypogaea]